MPAPRKKKEEVDRQALDSQFARIPRLGLPAARDLLDLGFRYPHELAGRSPEALFEEVRKLRPTTPADRLAHLRLAVYVAETPDPEPAKLHPAAWA